ncbi:hypothetical protein PDIG_56940 [Penicillium digitatum PHI26]|uniref:Allantoate permease n=2 Tax=Penicillium digitatum TaxID=36651 RepID=K9FLG6_PEND2|nr:hypothetical protein PDIP_66490 [Penicillium digitatum Pd1]EKV09138.1 hypothetical protein PDIP_66490 [Penicillium digitatum Pd1]EKV10405.1 hypothetical protein PDIG_56940 [Penicillium digitatum PHI26]
MPDFPMDALYLSERERLIPTERLRADQMGISNQEWRWDHAREVPFDLMTCCWFFSIMTISDPHVLPSAGAIMMLSVPRHKKEVLLFGYYLVFTITPLIYAYQAQNTAGGTKKKCTPGIVFIGMCAGNAIGPLLYSTKDAPLYRTGLIVSLVMFVTVGIIAGLTPFYLLYLNMIHEKRRVELGKVGPVADMSMLDKDQRKETKVLELEDIQKVSVGQENGLQDMTDLKNEDIFYVY